MQVIASWPPATAAPRRSRDPAQPSLASPAPPVSLSEVASWRLEDVEVSGTSLLETLELEAITKSFQHGTTIELHTPWNNNMNDISNDKNFYLDTFAQIAIYFL